MSAAEWPRVGPIDAAVVRPNLSGGGTMSDQCECEACQRTYGRAGGQPVGQTRHADVERVERPLSLTDFLLARIAEDERDAREATRMPWRWDPTKVNAVDRGEAVFAGERGARAITVASTGPADDFPSMADARHIARHDPARVLAECESKRRIVERHMPHFRTVDEPAQYVNFYPGCDTLRLLALPYADHPDYREEWKP